LQLTHDVHCRRNNTSIKLTEAKVVDARTVGALTESLKDVETLAFCRCWKSSTVRGGKND
jgi:hypothetical protein